MVERGVRLDSFLEQRVDKARVEIDSLFVDDSRSHRVDATPRDAEPIGVESELRHERDIVTVAPVVVAGYVAGLVEPGVARSVGESVPDAASGAVRSGRTFDLIRGRRSSPEEIVGEAVGITHSVWTGAGAKWRA